MLYSKFEDNQTSSSGEDFKVYTICEHCDHHVTKIIFVNLCPLF